MRMMAEEKNIPRHFEIFGSRRVTDPVALNASCEERIPMSCFKRNIANTTRDTGGLSPDVLLCLRGLDCISKTFCLEKKKKKLLGRICVTVS